MIYLRTEDIVGLLESYVPNNTIADYGLIESALARPRAMVFGENVYESIYEQAAALTISLVNNHCLIDGNKRLGLIGLLVFLRVNGHELIASHDGTFNFIMGIATTTNPSVESHALWIKKNSREL